MEIVLALSTFSLCFALFSFAFNLSIFLYGRAEMRRRAAVRTQLEDIHANVLHQGYWLPVGYSSATHFNKVWKLSPFEMTGILLIVDKEVNFYYPDPFETSRTVQFKAGEVKLSWFGSQFWPNGLNKWFIMEQEGKKHFFTVDVSFPSTIFASRQQTQELYNQLSPSLPD